MRRWVLPGIVVGVLLVSVGSGGTAKGDDSAWRRQGVALAKDQDAYLDKVYGAWYGKLIGLIAGQPTEGWGKEEIERKAKTIDFYPITGYMPVRFDSPHKGFLLENLNGSPPNDDSDLMITSLLALREHGVKLTSRNIAETWVKYVSGACTAELVALRNFEKGIWPPDSATNGNPYQEMIGAQMRGDLWGMIAPGRPDVAARYATLDATLTHTGNGIYGEQFIAAAVSMAFVEKDLRKIIERALAVVPSNSVYAAAVRDAVRWHDAHPEWQSAWQELDKKWGCLPNGSRSAAFADPRYNTEKEPYLWKDIKWVYADVNGAALTLALLYGEGDFTKSVCLAVMLGFDNDCNAGTVAAILGAVNGERGIPACWKDCIHDRYQTWLKLPNKDLKIKELAVETVAYGRQIAR